MASIQKERNEIPALPPGERVKSFAEVALGFDADTARAEAARCLNCKTAPCKGGCPVGVSIPEFLAKLKDGDFTEAGKIVKATNNLPSVCGRVCPQENQCEKLCVRARAGGAVAIGACERFVGDYMLKNAPPAKKVKPIGKRAAVIGSGPAGLTAAAELANAGVSVTVFEAFHRPGGVLVYGIPEFRLPKSLVKAEIDALTARGVAVECNAVAGRTVTIDELKAEYDAIFIGTGAGLPVFLNIEGENLNGVYSANEYLTRVNLMDAYKPSSATPVRRGKRVAVIGAGNVAMDAARTAVRMGAEKVTVIYRRGREEMPARAEEIRHAEEEGVVFELLCAPLKMTGENGSVTGLKCVRMRLTEPDATGRKTPVPVANSDFTIDADVVIVALGTAPNPLLTDAYPAIAATKKGTLIVDANMRTSDPKIYAGGDAVTGAATVILAMGAGRTAGRAILESFKKTVCL
ncbi:MAG: NADPH-dependent glutamate synthase [Clostridiales bacterium]|jgi:glutamate synthase (NADPH/NADH) small chain|nr:NADPH-dependent glutamate synthase [Clostridiales bacterium]